MAVIEVVMEKCCSSDQFCHPLATFGTDTEKTATFISCRKMVIFQLVMVKCCSSEDFFTHLPMSAMILEIPPILSSALKLPY